MKYYYNQNERSRVSLQNLSELANDCGGNAQGSGEGAQAPKLAGT